MALAKDLKIKGLVDLPENESKQEIENNPNVDSRKRGPNKRQKTKSSETNGLAMAEQENWLKVEYSNEPEIIEENNAADLSDTMPLEVNIGFEPEILVEIDSSDLSVEIGNKTAPLKLDNLSMLDEKVASLVTKSTDNLWHCTECSYRSQQKVHVKEHVESHIEGISIPCQTCPKVFSKRGNARRHSCKLY